MTSSLQIVTYELYTLEHSGWVLHSRYPSSDRQEAISEAKGIELNLERATKLVRETYHPDTNNYDEAVVRISPNLVEFKKKLRQQKRAQAYAGTGNAHDPFAEFAPAAENTKPMKPRQVITGVTMMTFSALIIAGGVTAIASLLLKTDVLKQYVSDHAAPQVLFATFLIVFLLAALPLISRYIPHFGSSSSSLPDDFTVELYPEKAPMPEMHDRPVDDSVEKTDGPPALFKDDPGLIEKEPDEGPAPQPEPEPEPKPKKKKKKEPEAKAEPKPEPTPEPTPEPEPEVDELDEEVSPVPDKQRMTMMRFLTGTITILKDICPQLDTYNKFGLNLVMAGACASLGQRAALSEMQIQALTQESITMLGGKASLAADFCRKLETYVGDPRYAEMYLQGQSALEAYVSQTGTPFDDIGNAMRSWNKPTGRVTGAKIVTIMFTDIVSSTLITYKRGDIKAQAYIRRHNSIVRQALSRFNGDEVKHTGDGIMACFAAPSDAIEAAVAIQKAMEASNQRHPDEAFQLRIGINTGEPIREDNDLFGSSVQLAARTCGAAGPGHIYISNVVRELVANNDYPMQQQAPRTLKGVKEAQTFYDLQWAEFPDSPRMTFLLEEEAENSDTPPEAPSQQEEQPPESDVPSESVVPPEEALEVPLTPDQVLNAAQQDAASTDTKTVEASIIDKKNV